MLMTALYFCLYTIARAQEIPSWKMKPVVDCSNKKRFHYVISFWATFCKPCMAEITYLQSISLLRI